MLFFGKRRRTEEDNLAIMKLETGLKEVKENLQNVFSQNVKEAEAMEQWRELAQGAAEQIESLTKRQQELERQIRRQSDSFEDLLEEIQDERSHEERLRQERRENSQKEQVLLSLIMCCREQMELLERQIQGDGSMTGEKLEAWQQQFCTMAKERAKLMRPCGLEEVGCQGETVDYEIHEVLSAVGTENGEKAGTVAQVYSSGFIQGGRVIRKARVAAYRLNNSEDSLPASGG